MKQSQKKYKRIVIKVGSSLFYRQGKLDVLRFFESLSALGELIKGQKRELVIVSSGAIALGMDLLKLSARPKQLPLLQAAAALGQNELMDHYRACFAQHGLSCAQVLLTWDDFSGRQRYLNAKNTLLALLKLGCVPVVNENDTISTEEIRFGDNDRLSALVAKLTEAELLVILSDVDGLLDRNSQVIPLVDEINAQIKSLACPSKKEACVGGMISKLEAAKIAMDSGISCLIANGNKEGVILSAIEEPERQGTLFVPKRCLNAKEHWIAFGTKPKGKIIVDDGARQALLARKSLLSVGVLNSEGNFAGGDIVAVSDNRGNEFARGKAALSKTELEKIKGRRSEKEVIHRDNIVILG